MAKEIEYKFLVDNADAQVLLTQAVANGIIGEKLVQGYINESGMTTRVRLAGDDKAFLTLKSRAKGISRDEFEYEIPREDGEKLLQDHCGGRVVAKTRYHFVVGAHTWDVDIYAGPLVGLATAEVELASEDEAFVRPSWAGRDISTAGEYTNEALARSGLPAGAGA
jgi:CYTH domain-containing protein